MVNPTPRPLYSLERDPVLTVQEAEWTPGTVWTGAEISVPTVIRSPDRPAHSELLYQLRYPAPQQKCVPQIFSGGKSDRYLRLTNVPRSCADCVEIWEPQTPGNLWACKRPVQKLLKNVTWQLIMVTRTVPSGL
jgi:hypothetical protein